MEAERRTTPSAAATQVVVAAAIAGALQRLESPSCQRVLIDFADENGRSLADNLSTTGLLRAIRSRSR
jgi:hypothetical protein